MAPERHEHEILNLPPLLSRRFGAIQIHPELRDLLPAPTDAEALRLEASLKEDGLRDPIVVGVLNGGRDQVLLDGHTRVAIWTRLGLDLEQQMLDIEKITLEDIPDAKRWILRNQLGRRNLTDSQRAMIAARLADLDRGDNQHTSQDGTSQAKAAELADVSLGSVTRATKVLHEGVPELVDAVDKARVDVTNAAAVATLPKDEQVQVVEEGPEAIKAAVREVRKRKTRAARHTPHCTTVRLEGNVEVMIDLEIEVKGPPEKAIRTTVERLSDLGKACRFLRSELNLTILVDAISRAVKTKKITISRALDDTDEELVSSDVEATALPVTAFSVVTGTGDIVSDSSDLASNDVAQCVDEPLPEDTP